MRRGSKGGIMKKSGFGAFVLMVGLSAIGISGLVLTSTENGIAQSQGMQNMPGMNMSNTKPTGFSAAEDGNEYADAFCEPVSKSDGSNARHGHERNEYE